MSFNLLVIFLIIITLLLKRKQKLLYQMFCLARQKHVRPKKQQIITFEKLKRFLFLWLEKKKFFYSEIIFSEIFKTQSSNKKLHKKSNPEIFPL